jgi:signal peptidase
MNSSRTRRRAGDGRRGLIRRSLRLLSGLAVLASSIVIGGLVAVPVLRGEPSRMIIVTGRSMEPTLHHGDVVFVWPADSYRRGDVTPFRVSKGQPDEGTLVIHRIVGGDAVNGFVMKGDNNVARDLWVSRPGDIIGRKVLVLPMLGWLLTLLRQPLVVMLIIAGLPAYLVSRRGSRSSPSPTDSAPTATGTTIPYAEWKADLDARSAHRN